MSEGLDVSVGTERLAERKKLWLAGRLDSSDTLSKGDGYVWKVDGECEPPSYVKRDVGAAEKSLDNANVSRLASRSSMMDVGGDSVGSLNSDRGLLLGYQTERTAVKPRDIRRGIGYRTSGNVVEAVVSVEVRLHAGRAAIR